MATRPVDHMEKEFTNIEEGLGTSTITQKVSQ